MSEVQRFPVGESVSVFLAPVLDRLPERLAACMDRDTPGRVMANQGDEVSVVFFAPYPEVILRVPAYLVTRR